MRRIILQAAAIGLAMGWAQGAIAAPGDLDVTFKPLRTAGKVDRMEVTQVIDGTLPAGEALTLAAAVTIFGTPDVADRITGLKVSDADGEIPMTAKDDPAKPGSVYYRRWTAQRAVKFPVSVAYAAAVQPDGKGSGPAYGLRPSGGGVAAMGSGFLLLPANAGTTQTNLKWDLTGLPEGSVGVINAGEGAVTLKGPGDALARQWVLAGPAGRYEAPGDIPFTGYWLGQPPFDPQVEMTWNAKAYAALARHYRYMDPAPPYRVFIKMLDSPPFGGGSAGPGAFLMSMAEGKPRAGLRGTFFHEMSHQWVGGLTDASDLGGWFGEGLNTHYSTVLPIKYGLVTVQTYLDEVNNIARGYYESKGAKMSLKEVAAIGFGDEMIRRTPYSRGAVYFADLDAQIRARSRGRRNLDSLVLPLFAARAKGAPLTTQTWEAAIKKELGPAAVTDFRATVLGGARVITPPSDAYGPCFRRVETVMKSGVDGSEVKGFQWERVAGVADQTCGGF